MDARELFKFIVLASVVALYVLLLLILFARALYALVSHLRAAGRSVKGPERVTRPTVGRGFRIWNAGRNQRGHESTSAGRLLDFDRRASIHAFSVTRRRQVRGG